MCIISKTFCSNTICNFNISNIHIKTETSLNNVNFQLCFELFHEEKGEVRLADITGFELTLL